MVDDEHDRADLVGEDRGVGACREGRAVDDHEVGPLGGLDEQVLERVRAEQGRRVGRHGARRHEEDVRDRRLVDDLLEAPAEREIVRQALERRVGELVHARERRPAQVALDDQHAPSLLGHHARERERARGLALRRLGAGDDDARERLLRREEGDVRPQDAEGLQEALLAAP
jgi:hypothetical protein